jgi:methyl-accepting chemotaxis protein
MVFVSHGVTHVLMDVSRSLGRAADQVASTAAQVSSSAQSLARGSSEQTSALDQTSASSEEINVMANRNARNSKSAADNMMEARQRVLDANRNLEHMSASMQEISASSNKISKIIKVIDEIAFQTNILALNAAVEAARAGEAGRGFAVVAGEVRNLAQRSARAASDTAMLIKDSIIKSQEGSRTLDEVVISIQAITEGTHKVKTQVEQLDASSKEQVLGIEQISEAVARMDKVTQHNATNAAEGAAASEDLNAQSRALTEVVRQLQALVGARSSRRNQRG